MRLVICNHARACRLTRHEGKMPRVFAAAKQKHFWANFSNRKTQVDKSTNRVSHVQLVPKTSLLYFPRSFAYCIIKLFNQNIPQKLCGETEYKDIRKSLTRGASFFSPNGKAERGNRDFPHQSMVNSRITNEEPPGREGGKNFYSSGPLAGEQLPTHPSLLEAARKRKMKSSLKNSSFC